MDLAGRQAKSRLSSGSRTKICLKNREGKFTKRLEGGTHAGGQHFVKGIKPSAGEGRIRAWGIRERGCEDQTAPKKKKVNIALKGTARARKQRGLLKAGKEKD